MTAGVQLPVHCGLASHDAHGDGRNPASAIARMLGVSERTVDGHLENLKQKMCETRRVRVAIRLKELGYQGRENTGKTG